MATFFPIDFFFCKDLANLRNFIFDRRFLIFESNLYTFGVKFRAEVVSLSIWQISKNFQRLFFFKKIFERQIFKE